MVTKRLFFVLLTVVLALSALPITPFAGALEGGTPVKVELIPYEGNPILTPDKALAWEAGGVGRERVIAYDDLLYMFYQGYTTGQTAGSVGYATSEDGLNWTKYEGNPVFVPDPTIAPDGVTNFTVVLNGETWMLYFNPWQTGDAWYDFSGDILVATATSPSGPWTMSAEPVLAESRAPDWDWGGRGFYSIVPAADGYVLFFTTNTYKVGRAMSSDGLHWTKYDDPVTTSDKYATSDPVFEANQNPEAWDSGFTAQPVVRLTDDGWEMFYTGGTAVLNDCNIGYATSPDGITWTRLGDTPLLADPNKLLYTEAVAEFNGTHYLYYVVLSKDYTPEGMAVATITYQ